MVANLAGTNFGAKNQLKFESQEQHIFVRYLIATGL
jgi:hypothetical protein